jgi:hypothetical protein
MIYDHSWLQIPKLPRHLLYHQLIFVGLPMHVLVVGDLDFQSIVGWSIIDNNQSIWPGLLLFMV